jgi:hypothetical protein
MLIPFLVGFFNRSLEPHLDQNAWKDLASQLAPVKNDKELKNLERRGMADETEFDALNSVKYLYLGRLTEPRDNSLGIVLEEAISNPPPVPSPGKLGSNVVHVSRIEHTGACRKFELKWASYVAYLVTEEVVGSCPSDDEIYTGNLFRTYTKSHFLDYLARNTGGHMKPVLHFKLLCLNHLIDVAAYDAPLCQQVESGVNAQRLVQ